MQLTDKELFVLVCIVEIGVFLNKYLNQDFVTDSCSVLEKVRQEWEDNGRPTFKYPGVT
jgi:hypothetical protein